MRQQCQQPPQAVAHEAVQGPVACAWRRRRYPICGSMHGARLFFKITALGPLAGVQAARWPDHGLDKRHQASRDRAGGRNGISHPEVAGLPARYEPSGRPWCAMGLSLGLINPQPDAHMLILETCSNACSADSRPTPPCIPARWWIDLASRLRKPRWVVGRLR
jgi:hypothetical protein